MTWISSNCREKGGKAQQLSEIRGEQKEASEKIMRGHDTFSSMLKRNKTSSRTNELELGCGTAELLAEHWIDMLEIKGYKIQYREPSWIWRVLRVASIAVVIAFFFIVVIFTLRIVLCISSAHLGLDPAFPSLPSKMELKISKPNKPQTNKTKKIPNPNPILVAQAVQSSCFAWR